MKKLFFWYCVWLMVGEVYQEIYGMLVMISFGYGQEIVLFDVLCVCWLIVRICYFFDGVKFSYDIFNIGFEGYF